MAKDDEEVVILEADLADNITELKLDGEDDAIAHEISKLQNEQDIKNEKNKKYIKIGILAAILIIIILFFILLIVIFSKNSTKEDVQNTQKIVQNIQKKQQANEFTPSKIDKMLQLANTLYENGNKLEALDIYKDVAVYNEAISQYNIGVAKMKENKCDEALVNFKNAILNKEKRTVSAINGAVCALKLHDEKLFLYYLDLAKTYLPEESNSVLFSYYAGLINFYNNNYIQSLQAFTHKSSKFYSDEQNYLASKIYSLLNQPNLALSSITLNKHQDDFTLALLYANISEYSLAKKMLIKAPKNIHTSLATSLVDMKLGNFQSAAKTLKNLHETNSTLANSVYPIKAILNKSFFNINIAQEEFKKNIFFSKKNQYDLIFYFAPYKVFDAKQTISLIRKGGLHVFIDETNSAIQYLKTSSTISKINSLMSGAIKHALTHHYIQANIEFEKLLKIYSKHAILHYNLALSYAQLGNYTQAYKHFSTSYRLDPKNYLAGIFASMSAELINQDNKKLIEDIKYNIDNDENLQKVNFYIVLLHLIQNNQFSLNRWLEYDKDDSPLHLITDIITSNLVANEKFYHEKSKKLQEILPNDIMANILSFHIKNEDKNIKEYANLIQIEFMKLNLDKSSFYYGSNLVKEQYVKMLQISGLLQQKRLELKKISQTQTEDSVGINQALAYIDLYTNHYEEAYSIYNSLIDNNNQKDTNTIFYAAVAAIGSNHHENAIALLELSKLTDGNNYESRYALGLLYHQIKNLNGASIQYEKIGNSGFISKYFDFEIQR